MNVDVLIYVNNLKEFFKNDEQAFKDMFGTLDIDKELYFKRLEEVATQNFEEKGEPTLSTTQMFGVVQELITSLPQNSGFELPPEIKGIFVHVKDGYPPICLN
jgi:hypothetical protein